ARGAGAGVEVVSMSDQVLRIQSEARRDGPDVTARVEVAAAYGEVISLNAFDHRLADARAIAQLSHGEICPLSCLRQRSANAHRSAPLSELPLALHCVVSPIQPVVCYATCSWA